MEKKKSCNAHDGTTIQHGKESCCEGKCYVCRDGEWVEKTSG